eukprot:759911-Hanusia_phi.AAC.5
MLDEIPVKMLHEMENSSTYPTKPLNQTFDVDEKLLKEEQERTQWEMESAFAEKEFSSDRQTGRYSRIVLTALQASDALTGRIFQVDRQRAK